MCMMSGIGCSRMRRGFRDCMRRCRRVVLEVVGLDGVFAEPVVLGEYLYRL